MTTPAMQSKLDDFLQDKLAPLPKMQKVLVVVLLFLLPVVAFYFLFYSGKTAELKELEQKRVSLQQEIDLLRLKQRQLPKLKAALAEARLRFEAVSVLLPKEKEIPSLLTNISALGTSSGLDFLSFRPQPEVPKEFYAEIPVSIKVRGQYHNIGSFFDKVSKLPRIVTISGLTMGGPKQEGDEMLLSTSFSLVTYRFLEETKDGKMR